MQGGNSLHSSQRAISSQGWCEYESTVQSNLVGTDLPTIRLLNNGIKSSAIAGSNKHLMNTNRHCTLHSCSGSTYGTNNVGTVRYDSLYLATAADVLSKSDHERHALFSGYGLEPIQKQRFRLLKLKTNHSLPLGLNKFSTDVSLKSANATYSMRSIELFCVCKPQKELFSKIVVFSSVNSLS